MARLEPFEPRPRLAVAVSGGRDSLALALLADQWVRARGGSLLALTVDHGIRPEAAAEAALVGSWLRGLGISHCVLRHDGAVPVTRVQERARAIRYALLAQACHGAGILHLLVAHHRDDQAETVAIRRGRGSGRDGLAGMAALREQAGAHLLRPLLDFARARLTATLAARGQPWIDDPSNADPRYDRVRLRGGGDLSAGLAGVRTAALDRAAAEAEVARLAAELVWIGPEGYALVDLSGFSGLPAARQRRLLQGVLRMVGTMPYAPRQEALALLLRALGDDPHHGRTLAGCRVLRWRGRLLVCRERAAVGLDVAVTGPGVVRWDDRFAIAVPSGWPASRIAPLDAARPPGSKLFAADLPAVPGPVRATLPALWNGRDLLAVPSAGWSARADLPRPDVVFSPAQALAGGPFAVV